VNERPQLTRIAVVRAQSRVTVAGIIRSVTTETVGPVKRRMQPRGDNGR